MKTTISYNLLILLGITSLLSCRDFLEEDPKTFLSSEIVYNDEDAIKAAVNGIWGQLAVNSNMGTQYIVVVTTTSGAFWTRVGGSQDLHQLNPLPNNLFMTRVYTGHYRAINSCNDMIARLNGKEELDQHVVDNALGQARLIRAMLYFNLVRLFGDIPLRLEPTSSDNYEMERTPREEVYAQVISDLEMAKTLLPEPEDQDPGRPHRYAAPALLAKVYLTLAGNAPGNDPHWSQAREEALEVFSNGSYTLVDHYRSLWDIANPNTEESIIEIQHSATVQGGNLANEFLPGQIAVTSGNSAGRVRANKETYMNFANAYPGDPRLEVTFVTDHERADGSIRLVYPNPDYPAAEGFPYIFKYIDPDLSGNPGSNNFIYLRYADVLLMLAEIENEINGPEEAYRYVNEVTARARNSGTGRASDVPADWADMNQEEFRERIMLERRFELAGEGHIWYDVRRRGEEYFLDFLQEHNDFIQTVDPPDPNDVVYPLNPRTMLLPIPSTEINTNNRISPGDQNPGY